ncbi:MAG: hypothetical protein AVDCRST_MAG77-5563 [uncultured Chloroflexi bacterium]|uniref:histidine kinase n=1 Tax=uncultured Chloroflexota bacterium TaxID=166587 RepID=A0A6J4KB45_9CHLR|nr:MAG: hypothetical protein AVDCRST_MAG77-5563 [uncultured Chloroflexota bacterium]
MPDRPETPGTSGLPDPWRVAAALVAAPSLEAQLTLLLKEAPRVGGADSATVYLLEEPEDRDAGLRVAAAFGETAVRATLPRPGGLTRHVLDTGQLLVIPDTTADPRVNPVVIEAGIRSLVVLPLVARRPAPPAADPDGESAETRTLGAVYINASRPHAFTPAAVVALEGLAALATVALENTLLLEAQRASARRLEEALQLREQFVSIASHELKGPLTPLKGYMQALTRRIDRAAARGEAVDEAWLRRALSVMVGQIDRLDRLVTDLLDVSRVRTGSFSLALVPTDLVALARETFERFRDSLAVGAVGTTTATAEPGDTRHTFAWHAGAESLPGVWDASRLDQVITNLLGNAVKYSPHGGTIELRVEPVVEAPPDGAPQSGDASHAQAPRETPDRTDLTATPASELRRHAPDAGPGWVHLSVRDEGLGLTPEEQRGAIFQAFARGESASGAAGFGLGLFICAEVVHRHGGAIWAESPGPGQGSTFHVLLPPSPPD